MSEGLKCLFFYYICNGDSDYLHRAYCPNLDEVEFGGSQLEAKQALIDRIKRVSKTSKNFWSDYQELELVEGYGELVEIHI
jgi:hypothetical protein